MIIYVKKILFYCIPTRAWARTIGFIFSSSGKFKVGLDNVYYKGQGALFKMISNVVDFDSMYPNVQLSLFNSLVASVLSYGCEVWGFAEAK